MRSLLTLADLEVADVAEIFERTARLKGYLARESRPPLLSGRVLALVFEKPSLRTRVSFEAGMASLGGGSIFLGPEAGFGKRESVSDFARVLSQYVDIISARVFHHATVEELGRHATCPVVNGLSDAAHPCQALADFFSLREVFGELEGKKLAYVGDGNNVARSLAMGCGLLGMTFAFAAPEGYQLDEPFLRQLAADYPALRVELSQDPRQVVKDASAVYTDVWASMGQEEEAAQRKQVFAPFQVNADLMKHAPSDAVFLHCLPAHRGEEVTDEVIDGQRSIVLQQAANRMHVQKGIVTWLLKTAIT